MKILFITPYDNNYRYKTAFTRSLTYMPLTMPYLAALIPEQYQAEVKAVDEGVDKCDYSRLGFYDIVAITAVTSSALRGYELADYFRQRGSYVAMGGHHISLMPEEALAHADTVLTGPGDRVWGEFLHDFAAGHPKRFYQGLPGDINTNKVIPRRDLMKKNKYIPVPTVIANFGCSNRCEFCVINSFWGGKETVRQINEVIDEIKGLRTKYVLFLDPSPTSNPEYAKAFYRALIPLNIKWAGLCTTDIADHPEVFELMIRSGCIGILMGFETFCEESLREAHKKNTAASYKAVVDLFHQYGVCVLGTFMLGFDGDTRESILKMPDYIEEIGVDIPRFAILTPYPTTPVFERLSRENRILSRDWNNYDSIHAVFQPRNFSARELEELMLQVSREVYSVRRIWRRSVLHGCGGIIKLMVNIGFQFYHHKVEQTVKRGWNARKERTK